MSLSVRKLFIDSRFLASGDSSSFEYELPEVLELPKDTVAFFTEFSTVCSRDTVSANRNDRFYVVESTSGASFSSRTVVPPTGAYDSASLRVVVVTVLHGAG